MANPDAVIRAAEEVAEILESRGVGAVVIGAVALAAHGYVRLRAVYGGETGTGTVSNPPFWQKLYLSPFLVCTCPRF